jgi:hypothetical protein
MRTLLLLLTVFCISKTFAQDIDIYKRKPWEETKKKMLQHKLLYNDKLELNTAPISDTPVNRSVVRIKLRPKYLGNNGKGADIYAMMPHNMPCLVPDSTFRSSMPVLRSKPIIGYRSEK